MQFKNPEILYFLFVLLLPILVHLFQLKRFKLQAFTNVAFLKEISLQTRKSSQLKKWLLLVCRLFLLTTLIIAFAQPYLKTKQLNLENKSLVIVLDNSFSMQAKGKTGPLLTSTVQEILQKFPKNKKFTLLTNDNSFWDIDNETSLSDLQKITYSTTPFQLKNFENKIANKYAFGTYDLVLISDGKILSDSINIQASKKYFYKLNAVNTQNIAIKQVTLNDSETNFNKLEITVQGYGIKDSIFCVLSILDNEKLYSKSKITVTNKPSEIFINLPKQAINGKIVIDSPDLEYDNEFYFSAFTPNENQIAIIGHKLAEVEKIFPKQGSIIKYVTPNQDLSSFQSIIVNQPNYNLDALGTTLKKAYTQGAQIIFIPNTETAITEQNKFLSHFGSINFNTVKTYKNSITTIHTAHPLYKNVFGKAPQNFEYPTTNKNFVLNGSITPILSFANQEIYLGNITNGIGNLYVFTSGLNKEQSTILQSPIIVPTLYNMAMNTNVSTLNNFEIGTTQTLLVDAVSTNSKPLYLVNKQQQGIAQQQPLGSKTKLIFNEFPTLAGNYYINQNEKTIAQVSLNYPRTESDLTLPDAEIFNNFVKVTSIDEVLYKIDENRFETEIWKYFILTTLLFLILELLIQKFVK